MTKNLSSAAVVIDALRVNPLYSGGFPPGYGYNKYGSAHCVL